MALALRDFGGSPRALAAAASALEVRGDHRNALQARLVAVRRLLLLGRLEDARAALARLDASGLSPALAAVAALAEAELALRSLSIEAARVALDNAHGAAGHARIPALVAEVADMRAMLDTPLRISQNALARAAAVPPRRINEIVLGKPSVTADTAVRPAAALGTSERFWLGLQADYDLEEAHRALGKTLARIYRVAA